jgi:hypothetical protein
MRKVATMGFMDKVKGMLGQHSEKVSKGIDRAGQMADTKTKGKYSSQIRSGTEKAKQQTDKLGRQEGEGGGKGGDKGSGKGPGGS